jgi:ABC-type sugar transport system substrate-binding protein
MKKRVILCLAAMTCLCLLFACNRPGRVSNSGKRTIKIGFAFANIDENNKRILDAIRLAISAINEKRNDIFVEFLYTDAQLSVEKQMADVESLIQQKPDWIELSAVDTVGSIPAARAIHNAGILVGDNRGMKDDSIDLNFLGMDEYSIQVMIKEWLFAWLNDHPDTVLKVGLIYGNPIHTMQLLRCDAIKDFAEEVPERIQILDERYGNWSTPEAMAISEDWLQRYPEMNCICTASDDMALGASNAVTAANRLDEFLITSIDGTAIGVELVETGKIDMTVKALMTKIEGIWVDVVLAKIEGTMTDKDFSVGRDGLVAIDSTNVAIYKNMD